METLDPILSVAPERLIVAFESIAAMLLDRVEKILFQSSGVASLPLAMNGKADRLLFMARLTGTQ
jgi:hypothetical protein